MTRLSPHRICIECGMPTDGASLCLDCFARAAFQTDIPPARADAANLPLSPLSHATDARPGRGSSTFDDGTCCDNYGVRDESGAYYCLAYGAIACLAMALGIVLGLLVVGRL